MSINYAGTKFYICTILHNFPEFRFILQLLSGLSSHGCFASVSSGSYFHDLNPGGLNVRGYVFQGSDLIGGDCVTLYERYDQFLSLMGIPAVVTVVISTSILLLLLKQKKEVITAANSADSQTQRPVSSQ